MDLLMQFGILTVILFISEVIVNVFSLNLPSTILGMIIFLFALYFKVIKLEWVEGISKVLIKYLPIFFIPTIVGVMDKFDLFEGNVLKLLFIIVVSTTMIIVSSSLIIDRLVRRRDQE